MSTVVAGWKLYETPVVKRLLRTDGGHPHRFNVPEDALRELAEDPATAVRELSRLLLEIQRDDHARGQTGRLLFSLAELGKLCPAQRPQILDVLTTPEKLCVNGDDRCSVLCRLRECPEAYVPTVAEWLRTWGDGKRPALTLSYGGAPGRKVLREAIQGGYVDKNKGLYAMACYAVAVRVGRGEDAEQYRDLLSVLVDNLQHYERTTLEESAFGPRAVGAYGEEAWEMVFSGVDETKRHPGISMALACGGKTRALIERWGARSAAHQALIVSAIHRMAEPRCRPHHTEQSWKPVGDDAAFVLQWLLDTALFYPAGGRNTLRMSAASAAGDVRQTSKDKLTEADLLTAAGKLATLLKGCSPQEREAVLRLCLLFVDVFGQASPQVAAALRVCAHNAHNQRAARALAAFTRIEYGPPVVGGKTLDMEARGGMLASLRAGIPSMPDGVNPLATALAETWTAMQERDAAVLTALTEGSRAGTASEASELPDHDR